MCEVCFNVPLQRCNAAVHFGKTEAKLECGCAIPVITDACKSKECRMLVKDGKINGHQAVVMRDTGCSTIVVKKI